MTTDKSPTLRHTARAVAASLAFALLAGCAANGSNSSVNTFSPNLGNVLKAGCLAIAAAGGFDRLVKPAVDYHRKRGMNEAKLKQLERGYAVALGFAGCVGIPYFANSIYAKLSEDGKKDRERALSEAASSGKQQVYRDPVSGVSGAVKPGETYDVAGTNEECKTQEDTATHSSAKENILVNFCRVKPDGIWQEKRGFSLV